MKTEDRRQKTEDGRQKTDDRKQKTDDRRQMTADRKLMTDGYCGLESLCSAHHARNSQPAHFANKCATASSRPSSVNSNMGKISRMALIVRV